MDVEITRDIAAKVLATVDAGLSIGLGNPILGEMCVEAAVCYALGQHHGDDPGCVSTALRAFKMSLNDSPLWSGPQNRGRGLRRLALAQLGSENLDDIALAQKLAVLAGEWAASAATHAPDEAAFAIDADAAPRTLDSIHLAAMAATSAAAYAAAAYAADAAADAAADNAATHAANAAAKVAVNAAGAYANANAATPPDQFLARVAEDVVQVLISLGAPGIRWLELAAIADDNAAFSRHPGLADGGAQPCVSSCA